MSKKELPSSELEKLQEIFKKVDPSKQKLVENLIRDAAFLAGQNETLRKLIDKVGMVKVHPDKPELQKSTEAGKQYLKNLQAYSIVIKTLNSVLTKSTIEDDDDFDNFMDDDE